VISLAQAGRIGVGSHAVRVSNGKAARAPRKNRRRLRNVPAIRTPAFEMPRSAGIESNTGSLVVIIFFGGDLVLYRVLGEERGNGGCVVVVFSLVYALHRKDLLGYLWIGYCVFLFGKGRQSKTDCQPY
jgi:hypothetical protein